MAPQLKVKENGELLFFLFFFNSNKHRLVTMGTNWSTKSVTEGATTKHELEHKKCHGGSTKSVTEEATTKHELEHKKCHGGCDQKAQTGAQKVSRREGTKSGNLSTKSVTEGVTNWQRFCIVKVEL